MATRECNFFNQLRTFHNICASNFGRFLILADLVLIFHSICASAEDKKGRIEFIPKSPEAAAFDRVSDIAISQYTGQLNLSIPLYTVTCGELSLPISLDYQGSAIKVEQEATWVGLNWLLNAGGSIITKFGLHTSENNVGSTIYYANWERALSGCGCTTAFYGGNYQIPIKFDGFHPNPGGHGANWFRKLYDSPDTTGFFLGEESSDFSKIVYNDLFLHHNGDAPTYHAVFCGNSLSFVWDKMRKEFFITGDKKGFCISGSWFAGITITDGNGTRYRFHEDECLMPDGSLGLWEEAVIDKTLYLSSIESPRGDTIRFNYDSSGAYWPVRPVSESLYSKAFPSSLLTNDDSGDYLCQDVSTSATLVRNISPCRILRTKCLHSIVAGNTKVLFVANTQREDLNLKRNRFGADPAGSARRLDRIEIYRRGESGETLIRKFNFSYSYFERNTTGGNTLEDFWDEMATDDVYSQFYPNDDFMYKRLRLDKLQEYGEDGSHLPAYSFSYYNTYSLPGKNSASQDYWGYYNGKENLVSIGNKTYHSLLAKGYESTSDEVYNTIDDYGISSEYFADRRSDVEFMKAGLLSSITYPSGASDRFEYEQNTFTNFNYKSAKRYVIDNSQTFFARHTTEPVLGEETSLPNPVKSSVSTYGCNVSGYTQGSAPRNSCFFLLDHADSIDIIANFTKSGQQGPIFWNTFSTFTPVVKRYGRRLPSDNFESVISTIAFPVSSADTSFNNTTSIRKRVWLEAGRYELSAPDVTGILPTGCIFQTSITATLPLNYHSPCYGCGLRLASVTRYDGDNVLKTEYRYKNGVLMAPVLFARENTFVYQLFDEVIEDPHSGAIIVPDAFRETYHMLNSHNLAVNPSHVSYSHVESFSKDATGQVHKTKKWDFWNQRWTPLYEFMNIAEDPRNGRLLCEQVYDEQNTLKSQTDYSFSVEKVDTRFLSIAAENKYFGPNYPVQISPISSFNPWQHATGGGIMQVCVYPSVQFFTRQEGKMTMLIEQGDTITSESTVTYNESNCQPASVESSTSVNGQQVRTAYYYPSDSINTDWARTLREKNIINLPIQEVSSIVTPAGEFVRDCQYTEYDGIGNPRNLYSLLKDEPRRMSAFSPWYTSGFQLTDYAHVQSVVYDSLSFNVRATTDFNNLTTVYIWGYRNQYPVAVIQGASHEEVADALNFNIQSFEQAVVPPVSAESLRQTLTSRLPSALVTTYSYLPLAGIIKIVSPNGYVKEYEYDGFQRLKTVQDNDGPQDLYDYHYRQYP